MTKDNIWWILFHPIYIYLVCLFEHYWCCWFWTIDVHFKLHATLNVTPNGKNLLAFFKLVHNYHNNHTTKFYFVTMLWKYVTKLSDLYIRYLYSTVLYIFRCQSVVQMSVFWQIVISTFLPWQPISMGTVSCIIILFGVYGYDFWHHYNRKN